MSGPAEVLGRLRARYGPQGWWPAETRFEVVVGALLMAQTTWRNVERAIANLKDAGAMDPRALAAMDLRRLRTLVAPAGLHRTKPRRLRGFCRHLVRTAGGDLDRFFRRDAAELREELLGLDGVGPETADSILLYAADVPTFVVDAYTLRIGRRIGWFREVGYREAKAFLEARLPRDLEAYREGHALLVAHAKAACRPRPACDACAVRDLCAHGRSRRAEHVARRPRRATFK